MWFDAARDMIMRRKLRTSPKHKVSKLDIDIGLICRNTSYGDWMLFYQLIKNMDSVTYAEWLHAMTEAIKDKEEKKTSSANPPETSHESYPMLPQMSTLIM